MYNPKLKVYKIFNDNKNKVYYVPSYNKEQAVTQANSLSSKLKYLTENQRLLFKKMLTQSKSHIKVRV